MNPLPVTITFWPSSRSVEGSTASDGVPSGGVDVVVELEVDEDDDELEDEDEELLDDDELLEDEEVVACPANVIGDCTCSPARLP